MIWDYSNSHVKSSVEHVVRKKILYRNPFMRIRIYLYMQLDHIKGMRLLLACRFMSATYSLKRVDIFVEI